MSNRPKAPLWVLALVCLVTAIVAFLIVHFYDHALPWGAMD